jgi:branched-chain amino acid transport system ATP-binding protein
MNSLLEVQSVTSRYGDIPVLHGISLSIAEGEAVGLLGPNGHGKTTLLRVISGMHRATSGEVMWRGTPITNRPPHRAINRGLVHVLQGSRLFPDCTVAENLTLGAYSKRGRPFEQEQLSLVYSLFPRLYERRQQLCRTLSGGERQMAAIGVGLMGRPDLLMLDEPTLGLAPKVREALQGAVNDIHGTGVTLLIVDSDVEFMLSTTERWYRIQSGRVTGQAASSDGLDPREVVRTYFGSEVSDDR